MAGTITVRRPAFADSRRDFESRLLPLFKQRTEEVGLSCRVVLTRLRSGLRGLLGSAAPLSGPSIARLKTGWQAEYATWKHRRLDELEPAYLWADEI
jgi:hypothetical protein